MRWVRWAGLHWRVLVKAAGAGCAIVLCAWSCTTGQRGAARSGSTFSEILFSAAGVEDVDRDGNISSGEWRRKIVFGPGEPLYLVIDDPEASRAVRLKLVGANGREYDLPQPIRTVKNAYVPVVWERASEARDLMGADIIMAELYDDRTGRIIGACTFSVE